MLTKEKIHYTIDSLPDNLTIDQVIDQMILLDKIERGIKDADEGRIYSTEEVKENLNKWLKQFGLKLKPQFLFLQYFTVQDYFQ